MTTMSHAEMHEQMMEWGAQRDEAREALRQAEKRLRKLETQNGRMRAALSLIHDQALRGLGGHDG